jgi:lipoate-protein ligase A
MKISQPEASSATFHSQTTIAITFISILANHRRKSTARSLAIEDFSTIFKSTREKLKKFPKDLTRFHSTAFDVTSRSRKFAGIAMRKKESQQ